MDEEREIRPSEEKTSPLFYLGNLDPETIQLLIEDKIATGG
jgi:hypothetical protein